MPEWNDLKQLRAFVQVAESGSISSAAKVLGISQPTLTRQLQALERVASLPLVRRDTHNMSLTEAGRTLLPDARRVLVLADRVKQRLRAEREDLQGHLRIVSVVDVGQWIISRALASFRSLHPWVTAELHLINRPTKFLEEGFDCGFFVGEPVDKSLVARKIGILPRMLVVAPEVVRKFGVPESPEDLKSIPWLGILQPHFYSRSRVTLVSGESTVELNLKPVLLLDSVTALREAAVAGAGFTMLPTWLVGDDLARGRLVPLLPKWVLPDFDLFISYTVEKDTTARLRAFLDHVKTEIPRLLALHETGSGEG
ncbi:MAG: LysR family transcriptional regulator [Verrucomicrobiales bacterium]|nr:LysR family transcriptional regulator [Verrucomicrobiales bacterium]